MFTRIIRQININYQNRRDTTHFEKKLVGL